MMTFDLVLPTLVRACEAQPGFSDLERACAVRDLRGRVRLVVAPGARQASADVEVLVRGLEQALDAQLGRYFAAPILTTVRADEAGRLAREVLHASRPWDTASYEDPATGRQIDVAPGRWRVLERRLSKEVWLARAPSKPPWPLIPDVPSIVTFYSFKGGVGRTTALASCAWQLAREGRRVAAIDLDLEAPGLGALLGAETDRGVLDAIVDHLATGDVDIDGLVAPAQALGVEDAARVDVLPAGRLGVGYVEKLARLDFAAVGPWETDAMTPVEAALRALLRVIKKKLRPDAILLDARAGLHDLAGLSLHGLAHVDVLVTRASEQAHQGFDLTVQALGLRKPAAELRSVVVHSFAPSKSAPALRAAEREQMLQRSYESFDDYVYTAYTEDAPALEDETAAHFPWMISQDPDLERFASISAVKDKLLSEEYQALKRRIDALCRPEQPDGDDEEQE
ncbi:uncharacterized protein SOCE26_105440 [Sorangium cellulosum]|uniref:CobQ/CobB/MinD/ParA nucleotide binding domain-containing protein n=1 Tax=Sorangium cellulosum TaxID=56 RepID=A0A2L0FC59_SORCE|nr:P-loop NTPase [Sorangium cellulosum]AUX48999.1 uncharacterized protein SOCE26_105440 [Sorangium cellulosum]